MHPQCRRRMSRESNFSARQRPAGYFQEKTTSAHSHSLNYRLEISMMLHVRGHQSFNFQSGAFTVVFLSLIHSCGGLSQGIGPFKPIVALLGDDIILPCHLEPVVNASNMTVEWARPDLDPRFVHVRRDRLKLKGKKHPSYRGRTSLFTDELKHGNISLKLSKVKVSDKGEYRCLIPELGIESTVQLVVGAASTPVIRTTSRSGEVTLHCESSGWYPEPEVLWLDGEGNLLSAGPTETVRGPDDLYTVSSRVTVEKRHSNSFTCRVQQKDTNQTRETDAIWEIKWSTDTYGYDTYDMYENMDNNMVYDIDNDMDHDRFHKKPLDELPLDSSSYYSLLVLLAVGLPVMFILLAFIVKLKLGREKFKNKNRSPEEQPDRTEEEGTETSRSDNKAFHVKMEGEEASLTLMAGGEEETNVDVGVEEKIRTVPQTPTEQKPDTTGRKVLNDRDEQMRPVTARLAATAEFGSKDAVIDF